MVRMNCQECRRWWSPYLDSELDATKTFEISEHLRVCERCRRRFEREAEIDALTRQRLSTGDPMPDALWATVRQEVRKPRPQAFRIFGAPLALAASVALIFVAGFMFFQQDGAQVGDPGAVADAGGAARSVADLLREASPELAAFQQPPASDFDKRLGELTRTVLGASVTFSRDRAMGHSVRLIDVVKRTDDSGSPYLELHINCCGKPVLVAMSRRQDRPAVREIQEACGRCAGSGDAPPSVTDGVAVLTIERNGVIIAAAGGDDPQHKHVDALLASVTVASL